MSQTVKIESAEQFSNLLKSSRVVVADFYADWCQPCKQIAPFFAKLSQTLSKPNIATFVKIDVEAEACKPIAAEYAVSALPTFIIFHQGSVVEKVKGANTVELQQAVENLSANIENAGKGGSSTGGIAWKGADLPKGYTDITDTVDVRGLELLNADTNFSVRTLFSKDKPSALEKGKSTSTEKDWVESDTDEQLLLYTPFNSSVKIHTLQITSLPPTAEDDEADEDELPMRPKTIKLYTNRPHNLGFDEAEDIQATQEIEIAESDWNSNGTASIGLRFVRFQNVTSVVLFVVDGDGDTEKVRLDRVRFIGESGEKREMGKLEKIGDEPGE